MPHRLASADKRLRGYTQAFDDFFDEPEPEPEPPWGQLLSRDGEPVLWLSDEVGRVVRTAHLTTY